KIVAPGLIDIHTHAGRSKEGPALLLQDGVTGWVDAGSAGADNIDQIAAVARTAPQVGRALVNIAGISPAGGPPAMNPPHLAPAQGAIARHRDVLVGVKARLSENVADANDLEALRRAQEAAAPFNLPVMIQTWQPRADAASFSTSATGFSIISTGPPWNAQRSRAFGPIPSPRIGTSRRRPRASSTSPTSCRSSSCSACRSARSSHARPPMLRASA